METDTDVRADEQPQVAAEVVAPVGRDAFLGHSGKLREDTVLVDGLGPVLVKELNGFERAEVIETQATTRGRVDVKGYQRLLLLYGLADPESPDGARTPLLRKEDLDQAMRLGAAAIERLCERVEQLSGLSVDAEALAEARFPGASREDPVLPDRS